MELGPSGFPFEKYIAELYKRLGYNVKVGTIVQGKCVTHEIDVLATTEKEHLLVECKFHSLQGKQSDVKVSLYFHSRFRDVHSQWILRPEIVVKSIEGWVVTNTRFSPDALQYANCSGIKLLSWDFPLGNGLKDLVERYFLYPITCLTTISKLEKEKLLLENIVFCEDILVKQNRLTKVGIIDRRIKGILDEVTKMKGSNN
jgi:Holliday junction resolvase